MQDLSRGWREQQVLARFFVDLMMIGEGLGVVMMWHGHWVLYDVMAYWFPISVFGTNVTSYIEVISAFALLSLCHITSSLVRSGIARDDVNECIDCIGINATYFTHFFEEDIKKRESDGTVTENNNDVSSAKTETSAKPETVTKRQKSSETKAVPVETHATHGKKVSLQDLVNLDRQKQKSKKHT